MNIDYLIQLLTNRLNGLALAKDQAFQSGDLERIVAVDAEILDVQNTLSKLKLVASIEQTAAATPFTEAEVVKNGIEASFNPTILNDATEVLLAYDITSYATDPMHELKIQNILEKMGRMDSVDQIETYIKKISPDSPLTGTMVFTAATQYQIDSRLLLALMELDSRFGTLGIGVDTLNPGNVGNDGTNTKIYPSWEEGVLAVAKWLDNHRIDIKIPERVIPVVVEPTETPEEIIPSTESIAEPEIVEDVPVVVPEPPSLEETTSVLEPPPTTVLEETVITPEQSISLNKRKRNNKLA